MVTKNKFALKNIRTLYESGDKVVINIVLGLLLFGLILIYDATAVLSAQIYGFAYRFMVLQLGWIAIGLVGFFITSSLDLRKIKENSAKIFYLALIFLGALALFGLLPCDVKFIFAPCINGANRWFYLNPPPLPSLPILGVLGFQPSEFAKLALIIYLAARLEITSKLEEDTFKEYLKITAIVAILIFFQPNLSTATLIFAIGTVMYFASGEPILPMLKMLPLAVLTGGVFMFSSSYRRARLTSFLSQMGTENAGETSYHVKQILIALGSGGFFGLGFGQSRQKFQYLPEVFADSIFAIIGEELGFLGTSILVLVFGYLIYRGYLIARNSNDMFSRLLAVGVTTWIALQFFVNVGAMTQLIPLTGIPLPLISYGGSSLVFIMLGLGFLINISKHR